MTDIEKKWCQICFDAQVLSLATQNLSVCSIFKEGGAVWPCLGVGFIITTTSYVKVTAVY